VLGNLWGNLCRWYFEAEKELYESGLLDGCGYKLAYGKSKNGQDGDEAEAEQQWGEDETTVKEPLENRHQSPFRCNIDCEYIEVAIPEVTEWFDCKYAKDVRKA
jgi:hypothetical protein